MALKLLVFFLNFDSKHTKHHQISKIGVILILMYCLLCNYLCI